MWNFLDMQKQVGEYTPCSMSPKLFFSQVTKVDLGVFLYTDDCTASYLAST